MVRIFVCSFIALNSWGKQKASAQFNGITMELKGKYNCRVYSRKALVLPDKKVSSYSSKLTCDLAGDTLTSQIEYSKISIQKNHHLIDAFNIKAYAKDFYMQANKGTGETKNFTAVLEKGYRGKYKTFIFFSQENLEYKKNTFFASNIRAMDKKWRFLIKSANINLDKKGLLKGVFGKSFDSQFKASEVQIKDDIKVKDISGNKEKFFFKAKIAKADKNLDTIEFKDGILVNSQDISFKAKNAKKIKNKVFLKNIEFSKDKFKGNSPSGVFNLENNELKLEKGKIEW